MAVILQPLDSPHGVHKRNTNTPRLLIANMKKPRILLVDDDPNVLPVVAKLLAAHGLNAEPFTSAADLLSTIQPEDVGCVVTDLEMPGMSGIELQQALLDRESSMAIIVISGHADVPRAIRIMSQGAIMLRRSSSSCRSNAESNAVSRYLASGNASMRPAKPSGR